MDGLRDYGLTKDGYVLFVGRLSPEKGVHTLLEAMRKLPRSKKLVLVGGTSYSDSYIEKVKRAAWNEVVFLGQVEHSKMQQLYSNCYAYVLPSDMEGLSISLLEALSYGTCIAATNIPENLEVIGSAGLSFPPRDVDALRAVLARLLEHPEVVKEFRRRAEHRANSQPDWDDIAERTEELYLRLIDGRPSNRPQHVAPHSAGG